MSEFFHASEYQLSLSKYMGSVSLDELLDSAEECAELADKAPSSATRAKFAAMAGSAYIEAVIVTHDPEHELVDKLLDELEQAELYLNIVLQAELETMDKGLKNPDDQVEWLRAQVQLDFMDVYRDIACGEITSQTKAELLGKLQHLIGSVERHDRYVSITQYKNELSGLRAELIVIKDTWERYNPDLDPTEQGSIVIPSSYRADDGTKRKEETHDVVFLRQQPDTTFKITDQAEVKSLSSVYHKIEKLGRYASQIITVDSQKKINYLG